MKSILISIVMAALPASAQYGAKNGEWRFYGGDSGWTSPGGGPRRGPKQWI